MRRPLPPPVPQPGSTPSARCPRCGSGDLLTLAVGRRGAENARAAFCAGLYDRDRRRLVLRSCGYSGSADADSEGPATVSA